jgi:hypothetical protein
LATPQVCSSENRGFFITRILLYILLLVPSYAVAEITLLEQSPESLILELTVPEPVISDENQSGQIYQAIDIPGMGHTNEPGKPQVPTKGTLIAVPSDSQIQVEIIERETKILSGFLIAPAPISEKEVQVYQEDRFLPENPVEIGMTGYIRAQRVAQILFFPVRHNPVQKTVELDKRVRVKVSFINNSTRSATQHNSIVKDSPAFESMLDQLLLNERTPNRVRSRPATRDDCPLPLPPALKLSIDKTGVYALSHAYFQEALGLDLSMLPDSRQIQLTHQGQPVPIFIAGEEDGVFEPGDVMFFYAEAANGPYTRTNIYWLSLDSKGGARLNFRDGTPDPSLPSLTEFTQSVHVEKNQVYSQLYPKGVEKDHLLWAKINGGASHNMSVVLRHISSSTETATIRVMMVGKTDDRLTEPEPDHHTKILLNDVEISDALWNGQVEFLQEATIPQSSLLEGHNIVSLVSVGDTGALVDSVYINWMEVDHIATMTAVGDQLTFEAAGQGPQLLTIGGFTRSDLLVLDVTNPKQIVPVLGATVQEDDAGGYQIQYSDNLDGSKAYYAFSFAEEHLLKPAEISIDVPFRRLQSPCYRVDYFIIYHDSFNVDALKNLVEARGLQVMAVPVSNIYDEFNHGMPDPRAIKDFLTYAYENYTQPAPTYVTLVGDANQDLLNDLGHGINYIPTNLFYTSLLGVTATDNDYVAISGDDDFADMFLGRIPLRTQAELDAVVNKLIRYSQAPLDGWQRNVVFVTDNAPDFENSAEWLIEKHLPDYTINRIYLSQYGDDNRQEAIQQDFIQNLNTGSLITSYIGHGSVDRWAGLPIFESSDVELLGNPDKLTFLMTLNCINGWFSYYKRLNEHDDSLAEAFLKAEDKGAIAVWAPTGDGYTFEHQRLADEFFKYLFQENVTALGPLTTQAKIAAVSEQGISPFNLKIFTLFGDPSLHLRLE